MSEIGGGNVKLLDSVLKILLNWTLVLFASIDDRSHAFATQRRHIAGKRVSTDNNVAVNSVPPMTAMQDSPEKNIPGECGPKDEAGVESSEQGDNGNRVG